MTIVGGFDVHRKQITFDYVDSDSGEVCSGQIRPATHRTLRAWLGKHCPGGDAEFAVEGCTGRRFVVEELTAVGARAHLADPAETAALRGRKKRAKTDRADARLLRTLLWEGRLPEAVIPPPLVLEVRTGLDENRCIAGRCTCLYTVGNVAEGGFGTRQSWRLGKLLAPSLQPSG
jgi:hypothetical protein